MFELKDSVIVTKFTVFLRHTGKHIFKVDINPIVIYVFKVNHRSTRKRWEIYSKLTIRIPERRHSRKNRHSSKLIYVENINVIPKMSISIRIEQSFFDVFDVIRYLIVGILAEKKVHWKLIILGRIKVNSIKFA